MFDELRIFRTIHQEQISGEAAGGDGEPFRDAARANVRGPDEEAAEGRRFVGGEGGADAVAVGFGAEIELREEVPEVAPAAGEDAGPSSTAGAYAEKDMDENVVGKRAEAVLAVAAVAVAAAAGDVGFLAVGGEP